MQWSFVVPVVIMRNERSPPGARAPVVSNSGNDGVSGTSVCSTESRFRHRIRSPLKMTIASSPKAFAPRATAPGRMYTLAVDGSPAGVGAGVGDVGGVWLPHAAAISISGNTTTAGRRNRNVRNDGPFETMARQNAAVHKPRRQRRSASTLPASLTVQLWWLRQSKIRERSPSKGVRYERRDGRSAATGAVSAVIAWLTSSRCATSNTVVPASTTEDPRGASTPPPSR